MDFLALPAMAELLRCADSLAQKGWAERNGGNLSMLLDPPPESLPVLRSFRSVFPHRRCRAAAW